MAATITPAAAAELPVILDLLRASGLPPDGVADILAATVVAREEDRIVGCAAVELYGRAALLRSVAVTPERRGTGLGRQLTEAALDLARRRGARTVYLLTETAAGFFPRFGFRPIARDAVDAGVQTSVEFTQACPSTAQAMVADLA